MATTTAAAESGASFNWGFAAGAAFAGAAALAISQYSGESFSTMSAAADVPVAGLPGTNQERSFFMVKPDAVQRGLVSEIIGRFEKRGYKIVAMKMVTPSRELIEAHYDDLRSRPFFEGLCKYMSSGEAPVVAFVVEGKGIIKVGRDMIGVTDPLKSAPGTIRGDTGVSIGMNSIHGSDGVEGAASEIPLWFSQDEIANWNKTADKWIYE